MSEVELARAAQNGDATSLGLLLERHRAALYALALRNTCGQLFNAMLGRSLRHLATLSI